MTAATAPPVDARCAVDNDVLIKVVAYGLEDRLWQAPARPGMLGAAKYVVPHWLRKRAADDVEAIVAAFEALVARSAVLEPDEAERQSAASIEAAAEIRALQLDRGEAQLAAIAVSRGIPEIQTGDKRAMRAFECLLGSTDVAAGLGGRLVCLEQLFLRMLAAGEEAVRESVCSQPAMDAALSACFSCWSPEASTDSVRDGLASYVKSLREEAPTVLAA